MKYRFIILTILSTFIVVALSVEDGWSGTFSLSGQNEAHYARGALPDGSDYNYFDNYFTLNAAYESFRIDLRQTYRLPSEFDSYWQSGLNAFDKISLEYRDDNFTVVGGDFYRYWGHGLMLGSTEILEINFDSGLEGLLVEGRFGDFETAVYKGVELDTLGVIQESAEGALLSYWLTPAIQLGVSASHLDSLPRHPVEITRTGIEGSAYFGSGSYYAVYTSDRLDNDRDIYHHGFYGSASYFGAGWGLLFDYKHYSLLNYEGVFGLNSLQFAPTVLPEATMYLLDRHPRQLRYGDDVGGQMELTFSTYDWNNKLNLYLGSQQDDGRVVPTFEEEKSPYQGIFLNAERYLDSGDRLVIQVGFQEDVQFTQTAAGGFSAWYRRTAVGYIYEHELGGQYTVGMEFELMSVDDKSEDDIYWEQYLSLSASKAPEATITIAIEHSEDPADRASANGVARSSIFGGDSQTRLWPSAELAMNIAQRHQVRLFWGHERGGLKCSGGVCRWVNPFKGVKVVMTSYF